MKIGMLTGGGDCPGLNAVIRAVVRKGIFHYEDSFVGFLEGWRGVLEDHWMTLDLRAVSGILPRGGTILRTSRTNPAKREGGIARCIENLARHKLDTLICIGGRVVKVDASMNAVLGWLLAGASARRDAIGLGERGGAGA